MKCRNAKKLIFEFIDGLESDKDRLELEQHLAQCTECDNLASQLSWSMDLIHRAPQQKTSENFAWKVRLKLNQERNAIREKSDSYGVLFRSWNIRYVATAAAAFAVVLAAGLLAINSELNLLPTGDRGATPTTEFAGTPKASNTITDATTEVASGGASSANVDRLAGPGGESANPAIRPPRLSFDLRNRATTPRLTSQNSPTGVVSVPEPRLIDSPAVPTVAELDSFIGTQLEGMTGEQQVRYLNHSMRVISLRLLQIRTQHGTNQR